MKATCLSSSHLCVYKSSLSRPQALTSMRKVKCLLIFCLPGHPHWLRLPCLISSTVRAVTICWEPTRNAWVRQNRWILATSTGCCVLDKHRLQHFQFRNFVYCMDGLKTVCTKFKHTDIARSVTSTIHGESCLFPFPLNDTWSIYIFFCGILKNYQIFS